MLYSAQKSAYLVCLLIVLLSIGTVVPKNAVLTPPLSGTKYIGTGTNTQNYATLTAAFADVTANTLGGNLVLVLQSGYTSASETFPITAPGVAATGSYSITIYPDASGRTITGSNATAIIDLNGSKNIIIDGRVNGTGSTKSLSIENADTNGATIRFINDASNNTVKFCAVKGVIRSLTSGVVFFSTTTATTGNDDNTIDNCDIRDGATTPVNGIYSFGSPGKDNSGNTISNCNIYNIFSALLSSTGIYITSNNTQWSLTGNSIYQTASRTATSANTHYGIQIYSVFGTGYAISNNYIGGSAEQCGGTAWTHLGSVASRFIGLSLQTAYTAPSSVQGNTIKNFNFTTTSGATTLPGIWCGMNLNGVNANVGTVTGNTIGSPTGNGSVQCTTSTTGGVVIGMAVAGASSVINISNNSIGSISSAGSTTGISSPVFGIYSAQGADLIINNNLIGSTSTANSLWATTAGNGSTGQAVYGISHSGAGTILTVTNNTVANLKNAYASSGTTTFISVVRGIHISGGFTGSSTGVSAIPTVRGNTVYNLFNDALTTTIGIYSSIIGIIVNITSSTDSTEVSQNTVYSLHSTATGAGGYAVTGILYGNTTTTLGYRNLISRNNVHTLVSAGSGTSVIRGMVFSAGRDLTISNNMVRLGFDSSGTALAGGYDIVGISDVNTTSSFYNNTVYIGGSGVIGSASTYALNSGSASNTRSFKNNILVNARSNGTGTGSHYALTVGGTSVSQAGLTMSNNIYYVSGTGGKLGRFNSVDYTTLSSWQAATGVDAPSAYADPNFINPAGNATTGDIHLNGTTPAENAGVDVGVTDDFDGQLRSGLTPVDVGADAGNYTQSDKMPPAFSLTGLSNTNSTANRTISVIITDNGTGVPVTGSLVPRVWFRRVTPSASSWASNPGTLSSGTTYSGTWSFTLDYSLIGITPSTGDSIQYYFVAQDQAGTPNLGFNTTGGAAHSNVNTQTSAPTYPLAYKIVTGLSTSIDVGTGQTYTSLTGTGGLFAAINAGVLTGNTTVNITSDLSETGVYDLTGTGLGGYTLTIQPSAATVRVISNSTDLSASMIRLTGVTGVIFDGRFGGSGQYFRIINTHTTNSKAALEISGSSANITARNCIFESNSTGVFGTVYVGSGTNTGITISYNDIRDAQGNPGTVGRPRFGIASNATTNVINVLNNNVYNFSDYGINLGSLGNQSVITGNSVYYNSLTIPTALQVGIYVGSGNDHTINNNYVGGSAPNCGGAAWENGSVNLGLYGIYVSPGNITPSSVQGNTVQNIYLSGTGGGGGNFNGIVVPSGSVNIGTITGNLIGHPTNANSILINSGVVSGSSVAIGISNVSVSGEVVISNNTVANIYQVATSSIIHLRGINNGGTSKCTISGNTVHSLSSKSSSNTVTAAPVGIVTFNPNTSQVITGNTIYNLTNMNTGTGSPTTIGIGVSSSSSQGIISGNRIYGLTGKATGSPAVSGIYLSAGVVWTLVNNMIAISDSAATTGSVISGIYDITGTENKLYYNTVYISGSTGTSGNSYGYLRASSTTPTLRNNIFFNARTAGTGSHYAIGNLSPTPSILWNTSSGDYNLYVSADSTKMGEWGTGITQSFSQWKATSGGDVGSNYVLSSVLPANNLFTSPGTSDLHINTANSGKSYVSNLGTSVVSFTTDYDGTTRSLTTPDIGADEFNLSSLLRLTALVEGLYNTGSNTMIADTMKVYLRRTTAPYTIVDSSRVLLSTAGQGIYSFTKTIRDSSFYLQLYNKRALETWSKTGVTFNADTVNYDFTTAANKAYGDNQILRGTKYCLYSGDVTGDGVIDFSDLIQIDNDNANFVTGESSSDLNGDGVVDLTDLLIADNNNANFIARITPLSSKRVINHRPVKVLQY